MWFLWILGVISLLGMPVIALMFIVIMIVEALPTKIPVCTKFLPNQTDYVCWRCSHHLNEHHPEYWPEGWQQAFR